LKKEEDEKVEEEWRKGWGEENNRSHVFALCRQSSFGF
jgi:hypothetical protein